MGWVRKIVTLIMWPCVLGNILLIMLVEKYCVKLGDSEHVQFSKPLGGTANAKSCRMFIFLRVQGGYIIQSLVSRGEHLARLKDPQPLQRPCSRGWCCSEMEN